MLKQIKYKQINSWINRYIRPRIGTTIDNTDR